VKLHGYQRRAVEHLHANPRAALLMEMGLGKTATVLTALTPEHLPALVVAPKRVADHVWPAERDHWRPDLSLVVAKGTPTQRCAALQAGADVTVIGRDVLADAIKGRYATVVLDELSGFKDRSTARWKAARKLAVPATHVWGLTGTPTPNGLMDLWAQIGLLDNGQRLGHTLGGFRERFFRPTDRLPNGVVIGWELRDGADATIHALISDIALSMKAADLLTDLPPLTVNVVAVGMPPGSRSFYQTLKRDLVADLDALDVPIAASSAGVLTNKLSQVAAGFVYDENKDARWLHYDKLDVLAEVLDEADGSVLVFYRYRAEAEAIRTRFPAARMVDSPGALTEWNKGKVPLLLAHPASAGHGLNLQDGGHVIVWTSLDWSLELWQQANGRLARQGQKNPVIVHVLQSEDTVDESILLRLQGKATVQDALMMALA
jgi:SNF2 family DNA or RNA helicase